ncbi:MAG: hypothetical protein H6713_38845 [Myxococcales bacterium]|nr:hypothetical protein [Myxococcales bacterium]
MPEATIETLCVSCLAPCHLPASTVEAATVGARRTTFYCDDDLAIPGVWMQRPEGACACGGTGLIVPARLSSAL